MDSVAGSGKTTCILHIAKHYKEWRVLLLTYNAKLKLETRQRADAMNLKNLEVHTYHSCCVKYYDEAAYVDGCMLGVIQRRATPKTPLRYDLVVIDEAQDMNPTYFEFTCMVLADSKRPRMCIFGDEHQSIYAFNCADSRYIRHADSIYGGVRGWTRCQLSTSYRLTEQTSAFINACMLRQERMFAVRSSKFKPRYVLYNGFQHASDALKSRAYLEVMRCLDGGCRAEEVFVLAPSVKGQKSPIRFLENLIKQTRPDIDIYVPVSDEEVLD